MKKGLKADIKVIPTTNMTKDDFFSHHAPDFNFEKNAEELVELALEKGFIYVNENGFYDYS
tara:strand:+ start:64 stop:246 length:183 start_codon:yes stop_codon:yes gene_type:complete